MAKSILELYEDSGKDKEIKDYSIAPGISKNNPTSDDQKTPISVGLGNAPTDRDIEKSIKVGTTRKSSIEQGRGGKIGGGLGSYQGSLKGSAPGHTVSNKYGRANLGRTDI